MTDLTKVQPVDVAAEVWQELPTNLQTTDAYREISDLAHNQDYGALAQILQAAQNLDRPVITHVDSRQVHIHYNPVTTNTTTTHPIQQERRENSEAQAALLAIALVVSVLWAATDAGSRAGRDAVNNQPVQPVIVQPALQPVSP